jgi:hypothetical protein
MSTSLAKCKGHISGIFSPFHGFFATLFASLKSVKVIMTVIKRQAGDRRWGLSVVFPLTDGDGITVSHNRRRGDDRRKAPASLEESLILFSELPSEGPGHKQ